LFSFYEAFSRDLSDTVNGNIWYEAYCHRKGFGESVLQWSGSHLLLMASDRMS